MQDVQEMMELLETLEMLEAQDMQEVVDGRHHILCFLFVNGKNGGNK